MSSTDPSAEPITEPSTEPSRDPADWLAGFAAELGLEPPDAATVATLLDLAGVAAHGSARVAAPIAAYLVGRAGIGAEAGLALAREV